VIDVIALNLVQSSVGRPEERNYLGDLDIDRRKY
jgi:hypothetical protein